MANLKSDGKVFDANLLIETGATLTAGTLVWADVSGTNVVHAVRQYSGATVESSTPATGIGIASLDGQVGQAGVLLGVMCSTQTGTPNLSGGHQTGVAWYTQGVFEFNTTPTSSAPLAVGMPVWAHNRDTVVCCLSGFVADATNTNSTGMNPMGIVTFIPNISYILTNTVAQKVRVKLYIGRQIQVG